jgi:hypothetical protein
MRRHSAFALAPAADERIGPGASGTAIVIADHRLHGIEALADQVRQLVDGTLAPAFGMPR